MLTFPEFLILVVCMLLYILAGIAFVEWDNQDYKGISEGVYEVIALFWPIFLLVVFGGWFYKLFNKGG